MHKPCIYVETSVWSYAFADDAPESRKATLEFFDLAKEEICELFISDIVLSEISRASDELITKLMGLIQDIRPAQLELDQETDNLAQHFLNLGAIPPSKIEDAQHVAIAVVNELDMLASWNFRHLVNVRKKEAFQHISAINHYYKPLHIVNPMEVINEI